MSETNKQVKLKFNATGNPNVADENQSILDEGNSVGELEVDTSEEIKEEVKEEEQTEEIKERKTEETKEVDEVDVNQIQIDDVVYELDEKGNAIKDGAIVYTASQIAEFQDSSVKTIDFSFEDVAKRSGIELTDDKGNPINGDITLEALVGRESAVKRLGEQEGFEKGWNQFIESHPDIASIIDYKSKYGTIEGYTNFVDYSKITVSKDNKDQQIDLIYKAEIKRGRTPESAKSYIKYVESNNELESQATEALSYLTNSQQSEIQAIQQQQEAEYRQSLEADIKFNGAYYEQGKLMVYDAPGSVYDSVVNKGSVKGFVIPKEGFKVKTDKGFKQLSRREIFDYISKPAIEEDGMIYTQAQYDLKTKLMNPQEYTLNAIINLLGGTEQLIKADIEQEKVNNIRNIKKVVTQSKRPISKESDRKEKTVVLPINTKHN